MTEETIALKARQLENSQIIQQINKLVRNVRTTRYNGRCQYFLITKWLYDKLEKYEESVFDMHGLLVWECHNIDHSAVKKITRTILEDMTVLGEK